jgi:hypothetical protein
VFRQHWTHLWRRQGLTNFTKVDMRDSLFNHSREGAGYFPKNTVRKNWKQFEFFKNQKLEAKGWLSDVLACVRELGKKEFTLQEMYDFVPKLRELHPGNKHVPDKIR